MVYYTLSKLGHAWLEDEAPGPHKHQNILAALAELVSENDVPYAPSQIAHLISIDESKAEKGLKGLKEEGYIEERGIPKPEAAARLRIAPIEHYVESDEKRIISQERYLQSEKGRQALNKYWKEGKGLAVRKKYWKGEKGKTAQKRWRLKHKQTELMTALKTHPGQKAKIEGLLADVEREIEAMGKE